MDQENDVIDGEVLEAEQDIEAETAADEQEQDEPKKLELTQAELDAIVQKAKAKAGRKAERRISAQYEQQRQPQPTIDVGKEPLRTDFENDAQWVKALAKYELRQATAEHEQQRRSRAEEQEQQAFNERIADINEEADDLPDFDRDTFEGLHVTDNMAEAVLDSDRAAKIMAYMSNHEDEVNAIAKMSKAKQIQAIGKIEDRITKKTALPSPPDRVRGGNLNSAQDIMSMTPAQYEAYRAKQGAWWAKK
jgi:hypothetical protein